MGASIYLMEMGAGGCAVCAALLAITGGAGMLISGGMIGMEVNSTAIYVSTVA